MEATKDNGLDAATAPSPEILERRRKFWARVFIVVIAAVFPLTGLALWALTYIRIWRPELDVTGLMAISIGILGILVFFMFLHKYQVVSKLDHRQRWIALGLHAATVLGLFLGCIWLAFDSPWSGAMVWGEYEMQDVAKSWIISVLVVGTITMLGSLFDLIRKRLSE